MSTAHTSLEHHASAAGHRDQATQHHHRAPKLFERDHAYAARLVQIATAIRSVAQSPVTMKQPAGSRRRSNGTTGSRRAS
jgi:hypothetical protein